MTSQNSVYPDISDVLERKKRGRERLAALSFSEKIRILEAMRERDAMIRRARETRLQKAEDSR
ncbi:MAG TPA: hypothetical protein VK630_06385 [Reyranella sp.]|nr:hypothetical protein [Reyranella sp.]